jgi:hypothetical protein
MLTMMLASSLLAASAPSEIRVDVGRVNVAALPKVETERALPTADMVDKVEEILATEKCRLRGQSKERFDIDVPYAVLVQPDGGAGRVVVSEIGCPELETFVGLVVLELARAGDFAALGQSKARWFGGSLNFNLR